MEISAQKGEKISFRQDSPKIIIPENKWHALLTENSGGSLKIDVYVKKGKWMKYLSITDTIAPEIIDNNLVYRWLPLVYTDGDKMGIYQRNLENFENKPIIENTSIPGRPCINCHSFRSSQPEKMSFHIRKAHSGTLIIDNGKYTKYNTKTEYTMAPAAYTAWHPNGNLIAFSLNRIFVNFTTSEDKLVEVCDQASDLAIYDEKNHTMSSNPDIAGSGRETLPNWSPDGKILYFIRAPKAEDDMSNWESARYDLMKIGFDPETLSWGTVETLLSSQQTGKSITFPSASPDGRYILFCMMDHSYFSIFDKNSDLYLLDLKTGKYKKADALNSEFTESFHFWSKNGRWVVFSSKRMDEISTRPYFAYFDSSGNFHKPFVLPQHDPLFYERLKWNYNLPTLVMGDLNLDTAQIRAAILGSPEVVDFSASFHPDTIPPKNGMKPNYY